MGKKFETWLKCRLDRLVAAVARPGHRSSGAYLFHTPLTSSCIPQFICLWAPWIEAFCFIHPLDLAPVTQRYPPVGPPTCQGHGGDRRVDETILPLPLDNWAGFRQEGDTVMTVSWEKHKVPGRQPRVTPKLCLDRQILYTCRDPNAQERCCTLTPAAANMKTCLKKIYGYVRS